MTMPGRKRKPAVLRELHGNPSKRPIGKPWDIPEGPIPCPKNVLVDAIAKEHWDDILTQAPVGLLKPVDAHLLGLLCLQLSLAHRAVAKLEESNEYVFTNSAGSLVQSPYILIFHRSTDIARKLAAELCITVTSRARLEHPHLPPAVKEGEEDRLPMAARRTGAGDSLDDLLDEADDRARPN